MKCTGRNCPMQFGTVDPAHCLAADECPYVTKPLTNADRIRAMTDEEIENWYWWMYKKMTCYTDSHAFIHEWLKQEVTIEYDKIDEPFKGEFIKSWRVGEPLREEDFFEEEDK